MIDRNWCCGTFRDAVESSMDGGIKLHFEFIDDVLGCCIVFNCTNGGVDPASLEIKVRDGAWLYLSAKVFIDYCPWCGASIKKLYGRSVHWKRLMELVPHAFRDYTP